MFERTHLFIYLLPIAIAMLAFYMAWRRRIPMLPAISSLILRFGVIVILTLVFASPYQEGEAPGKRDLVAVDVSLGDQAYSEARAYAVDPIKIDLTQGQSIESFLRPYTSGQHKSPYVRLWLDHEDANAAKRQLEVARIPYHLNTPKVQPTAPATKGKKFNRNKQQASPITLSMPAIIGKSDSLRLSVQSWLDQGQELEVTLDGEQVKLSDQVQEYDLGRQDPGEHQLVAKVFQQGGGQRSVIHAQERTLVVLDRRDAIGVVSNNQRTLQAARALFAGYDVYALDITALPKLEALREARAILLPLNEHPRPEIAPVLALQQYVASGGLLFTTGFSTAQQREFDSETISLALHNFLPVRFEPPPELVPPSLPPLEDPPEKEDPKVEKKPVEATVGRVAMLFAIDHSGSMIGERWLHCSAALNGALEDIHSSDRAGVLLFTDETSWLVGDGISDVTPELAKSLRKKLKANPPKEESLTKLYAAANKGLEELRKESAAARVLVIISDGVEVTPPGENPPPFDDIRKEAIRDGITVVTLRVGAGNLDALSEKADERMKAMATKSGYGYGIETDKEKVLIPKIVLENVALAYRIVDEKEAEEKRKQEEAEAIRKKEAEAERLRREKEREALLKARNEEEKRLREEWEKRRREALLPLDHFKKGIYEVKLRDGGRDLLAGLELPAFGEGLAETRERVSSTELARIDGIPGYHQVALAYRPHQLGGVLFFAAPLDARHAGSWLAAPDQSAEVFDRIVRRFGRATMHGEVYISGLKVEAGRISFRHIGGESLRVKAYHDGGENSELPLEVNGSIATLLTPADVFKVDLIDANGRTLVSTTTTPLALAREVKIGAARIAYPQSPSPPKVDVEPIRLRQSMGFNQWLPFLLLLPLMLWADRWLRRQ